MSTELQRLRNALAAAAKSGDVVRIREARAALALAKAERLQDEATTLLASAGVDPNLPRCP